LGAGTAPEPTTVSQNWILVFSAVAREQPGSGTAARAAGVTTKKGEKVRAVAAAAAVAAARRKRRGLEEVSDAAVAKEVGGSGGACDDDKETFVGAFCVEAALVALFPASLRDCIVRRVIRDRS